MVPVDKGQGEDVVFLPQPVAAVDALFQLQGVVGQVVVDHKGSFLQVETPGAVVGGEQHFPAPLESLDGGIVRAAAVQRGLVLALQQREKHILRFHALGENDRFPCSATLFHGGKAQLEGAQQFRRLGVPLYFQRRPFHLPPLGHFPGGIGYLLQPPDNAPDSLQDGGGGGALQSQQPQGQIIRIHLREGQLYRLIDIGIQQIVEHLLLGRRGVLIGQQYPPGHLGVICRLDTEGAETVGTNQFGKLRVAFRAAEIPGQEFPTVGQNRLVDEPDQPVEIHNILFNGRPSEQQLEGTPGDALEGFRLLIALLVDGCEGVGLLEYRQIPGHGPGFILIGGSKFIGRDDNSVPEKRVGLVLSCQGVPLSVGREYDVGGGI